MINKHNDLALREKALKKLERPEKPVAQDKDIASDKLDTASDIIQEDYCEFDISDKQPSEKIVKIPLGKAGFTECYYDPLTKVARPIPNKA